MVLGVSSINDNLIRYVDSWDDDQLVDSHLGWLSQFSLWDKMEVAVTSFKQTIMETLRFK